MARRVFNFAALVSAIIFAAIVGLWLYVGERDPRTSYVSLSRGCHFGIESRTRLVVFNDLSYGPYRGSILSVSGPTPNPAAPSVSGFGDTADIYYRFIRWPAGAVVWTLAINLLYPLLLAAVLPAVWLIRRSERSGRGFPVEPKVETR